MCISIGGLQTKKGIDEIREIPQSREAIRSRDGDSGFTQDPKMDLKKSTVVRMEIVFICLRAIREDLNIHFNRAN